MSDQQNLEGFKKSLSLKGKQQATIDSYQRDARALHEYLGKFGIPLNQVDGTIISYYVRYLQEKHGRINSVRRSVIGIRQYFRYLTEAGHLSVNLLENLPIPARDEQISQPLTGEHLETLLRHTDKTQPPLKGKRDAAILCMLGFEGIKVSELISLQWADFIYSANFGSLRITGARGRVIPLHRQTTARILNYQKQFSQFRLPKGGEKKYSGMILAFNGRDTLTPAPVISRHGLKFLLYELAPVIGRKKLNTEMLRHFAMTHHLREGKSTEEIMHHFGLRRPGNINKHIAFEIHRNRGPGS